MKAHITQSAFAFFCLLAIAALADEGTNATLLTHRDAEWYGSTFWTGPDWTRVGKDWHHPGENTPSVRRFTAPRDGRLTVTGRVFKLHLDGDGIRASIRHNEREVWQAEIDGIITHYAPEWPIEQITVVDRNILRIGVYELKWVANIPSKVAINEAIELAKTFGGESSGRFVNGVLGAIFKDMVAAGELKEIDKSVPKKKEVEGALAPVEPIAQEQTE